MTFENSNWLLLVSMTSLIVWLIFIWKEKHHYPNPKFYVNSIIAFIALSALALLILKPQKQTLNKPFKAIVLTPNFKENQFDSLKKKYENLTVYNYNSEHKLLNNAIPEEIFILGDGLKEYDLWQLDSINTNYLVGNKPKGIVNINYKKQNRIGNVAIFNGRYLNASKGHKLFLETSGKTALDSILLNKSRTQSFQLKTTLKAQGNLLYYITEKDSLGKTLNREPLPLTILGENNLRIVIINDFPTFETKYLKNYLAEQGHEVIIKSQITKNRFKYEYFNTTKQIKSVLAQKKLEQFDLLIIDNSSLNKLSKNTKNIIKKATYNDGLGVFIQSDISFFKSKTNFASFKFNKDNQSSVKLGIQQKNINSFLYNFKNEILLQIIDSSENKIISAYKQLGLGKIGASVLNNSYELLLDGNSTIYKSLWANIIEKTSKQNFASSKWKSESLFTFKNEPFLFSLATQTIKPSVINKDSSQLALKQNINIPTLWKGKTHPNKMGWQNLKIKQDTNAIFNYYVMDNSKWQSLQSYKTFKANKRAFSNHNKIKRKSLKSAEPINLTYIFLIFIFSIGWLWLEAKL